ncbi:type VI secretion system baseplate subunit TssK [Kistimonas scapharcae]|uniref:Type VI secretion system baseplate subunit TssK n=1 Tax=Kistimonas scapharcae TaxID=1036133 RepID=A0ABP8V0T2_9GAMM
MNHAAVAWLEGAHVAPQHFQQQERYFADLAMQYFRTLGGDDFGFIELQLARELMPSGKVGLRFAKGVFPDATPFNISREMVIDIPDGSTDLIVYLTIPLRSYGDQEVGSREEVNFRYLLSSDEITDNTNKDNPAVNISLAEYNFQLQLGGRDLSNYSTLAVAKVKELDSGGGVVLDPAFIPPVLCAKASTVLSSRLKEFYAQLSHRAKLIENRIHSGKSYKSLQALYHDQLWQILLRQWEARLGSIRMHRRINTAQLYDELITLCGALSTISQRPFPEPKGLTFNSLEQAFTPLFGCLEEFIQAASYEYVWELLPKEAKPADRRWEYALTGDIDDKSRFIMAIPEKRVRENPGDILNLITLGPKNRIDQLVSTAIKGITLSRLSIPPFELNLPDHCFYEIDTESDLIKEAINNHMPLVIHAFQQLGSFNIRLFIVRR